MGKTVQTLAMIAVAIYAPYLAAGMGLTGFAATAFSFALQTGASMLFSSMGGDDRGGGGGGVRDSGMLVNKSGSVTAIPVVYGVRRTGGSRIYMETTDAGGDPGGTEYLHQAIAVAQGGVRSDGTDSIVGIDTIYFQDRVAWTRSGGVDTYFAGKLNVAYWRGGATQLRSTPDYNSEANLNWISDEWDSSHRCRGVAYVYLRMKYDRDVYPGAPTVLMDVNGKRIQAVNNLGVWTANDAERRNPANILYDYLVSNRYGKGIPASDIDLESFQAARTWCASAGIEFNCAIDTAQTIYNNTQTILGCANMNLVYVNGKYAVQPVKSENFSGVFDFNSDNILGKWTISLGNKQNRFNTMKVNFFNPDLDWQPDSLMIENAAYLSDDSGVVNEKSLELPYVSSEALARRIGEYYLDSSRYQTIVSFKAIWSALKLTVGDPVTITHETPGWDHKRFRVNSITLLSDGTVDVVLEEYPADEGIFLENTV